MVVKVHLLFLLRENMYLFPGIYNVLLFCYYVCFAIPSVASGKTMNKLVGVEVDLLFLLERKMESSLVHTIYTVSVLIPALLLS